MCSKIQVLCGMVASGKGSYCINAAHAGHLIVNDDKIVNLVHADQYTLYDKKLKIFYKSIENHILALGVALGKTVIIDRGLNISLKGRRRWLALADSFDVPCEAIVFTKENAETHAQRRSKSDGRGWGYDYWLCVAKHHDSQYVEPTLVEGFSAIHYIDFDEIQKGKVI